MHLLILNKQMYNMKSAKSRNAYRTEHTEQANNSYAFADTELNVQFLDLSCTQHNAYIIYKIFMIISFSQMLLKLKYRAMLQTFCIT
jgi:hypothetical protein